MGYHFITIMGIQEDISYITNQCNWLEGFKYAQRRNKGSDFANNFEDLL
jgi:hypothetical protein